MPTTTQILFNVALTGTQNSTPLKADGTEDVSFHVEHPAATTTTYTVEVSNNTEQEIQDGIAQFFTDTRITVPAKSAAENFGVDPSPCRFHFVRLHMVTTVGSGVGKIIGALKKT